MPIEHPAPDPTDVRPRAGRSASAARRYRDLCSTCNHAAACGGLSTPERPIFFCEQFEAFAPVPAREPVHAGAANRQEQENPGQYKGLCVNCENRRTCAAPKPDGGVWHCEEYR